MKKSQQKQGRSGSKKGKHAYMLDDAKVRRWYDDVCRGSIITADTYLRRLGNFKQETGLLPADLLKMSDEKLADTLLDFVSNHDNINAPSYTQSTLKAIKSFLSFNNRTVTQKITIRHLNRRPTVEDERVPTQDELHKLLMFAGLKDKVIISLMSQSGLRPEVLGSYMGDNGLRIKNIPDITLENNAVSIKTPALIRVPINLSKNSHEYVTFLSEEGCGYLQSYLNDRIAKGEKLTQDSPIITATQPKKQAKRYLRPEGFITTTNITRGIRQAIVSTGLNIRPYTLRHFFDSQLLLCESKQLVPNSYRVYWMGHVGSMDARYTTNKNNLPIELINDMRASYTKCQPYLQSVPLTKESNMVSEVRSTLLKLVGFSDDEIKTLSEKSEDEVIAIIKDKLGQNTNKSDVQTIVEPGEAEPYILQGYQYVNVLPSGKWVLKNP